MLRRLGTAAIFVVVAIGVPGQPNNAANDKANISGDHPPAVVLIDSHDTYNYPQQTPPKPQTESRHWYTPLERPDWWLVLVAGITGALVYWQAQETRKAANAARDATELARIMQKKERASFSIDRVILTEEREYQWPGSSREPGSPKITITNQGSTYAFEVSCQCAYFASRKRVLSSVPRLYNELAPTAFKSGDAHTIEWETFIPLDTDAPGDSDDPVRDEQAFLHVYVVVSYRDVFGKLPDAILHLLWQIDREDDIETGDEENPYSPGNDYSKWVRVEDSFS